MRALGPCFVPTLAFLTALGVGWSTEVSAQDAALDALNQARAAYDRREYDGALTSLEAAAEAIAAARGRQLAEALPKPPEGWSAEPAAAHSATTGGSALMVSARRDYQTPAGGRVTVAIEVNSPMLQSFGMVFSNPMMMQASGAQPETVQGHPFAVNYRAAEKRGELKSIIAGRYLVAVTGEQVTRDELLALARTVDYEKLSPRP